MHECNPPHHEYMSLFRNSVLLAGLAVCTTIASAATITVTGVDATRGQSIFVLADGQVVETYAGAIVIALDGGSTMPVMCVDLFTHININDSFGVNYVLPADLDPDISRGLRAAYLYVTQFGNVSSSIAGAAMQLAIWDIIHDGGDGFSAGRIQASTTVGQATDPAISIAALQYVTFALNYQQGPTNATIFRNVDGPYVKQQLMGASVPEPASMVMMSCGIALLGWRKMRNRKRVAQS